MSFWFWSCWLQDLFLQTKLRSLWLEDLPHIKTTGEVQDEKDKLLNKLLSNKTIVPEYLKVKHHQKTTRIWREESFEVQFQLTRKLDQEQLENNEKNLLVVNFHLNRKFTKMLGIYWPSWKHYSQDRKLWTNKGGILRNAFLKDFSNKELWINTESSLIFDGTNWWPKRRTCQSVTSTVSQGSNCKNTSYISTTYLFKIQCGIYYPTE